jgi:hypothetical protein
MLVAESISANQVLIPLAVSLTARANLLLQSVAVNCPSL